MSIRKLLDEYIGAGCISGQTRVELRTEIIPWVDG